MSKWIDMTGQKIGLLKVISFSYCGKQGAFWKCECECGSEVIIRGSELRRAGERRLRMCRKCKDKATGFQNRLPIGEAARNRIFQSYSLNAARQQRSFDLTRDHFLALTSANCHYCGGPPSNVQKEKWTNGAYHYNGIDRMDNSVGYTPSNCVTCCVTCNFMKQTMTYMDFIQQCKRVGRKHE